MTDGRSSSALREWRRHLGHPATLGSLLGVGLLLALMGPFGTAALLDPVGRTVYWVAMAGITYAVGYIASDLATGGTRRWIAAGRHGTAPGWVETGIGAVATGAAVTATVLAINRIVFGGWPDGDALLSLAGRIFLMGVIVALTVDGVARFLHRPPTHGGTASRDLDDLSDPAILDRLPLAKRGPLIALSVEDHYVRVRTDRGEEMILLRLSDAIRETAPVKGLQVHRSHWVALDRVVDARRRGDGAILTMAAGADIPVSRANVPAVRDAGLLPKT